MRTLERNQARKAPRWGVIAILLIAIMQLAFSASFVGHIGLHDGRVAGTLESVAVPAPDDIYLGEQWGINRINAPQAWQIASGNSDTVIAILDTGIDQTHPDLAGKVIASVNFTKSPTANDVNGHGTHIAGIVGAVANNGIGIAGLAYDCLLMNVKVADDKGFCEAQTVAKGVVWAVDNGADVINMSLTLTKSNQALENAVNYAWDNGVVVVAAAGNFLGEGLVYPSCYENCIAVAATDANDALAFGLNPDYEVDVAAPGVGIYSTIPGNAYGTASGTSMAAGYASGLAGLLFGLVTDTNGNRQLNDEILNIIYGSCDEIGAKGVGSGRINAHGAVSFATGLK